MVSKSKSRLYPISSQILELIWVSYSLSKWRFLSSLNGQIGPPNYVDYNLEWLSYFQHVVQSSIKNMYFWYPFLKPHLPAYHKYKCPIKIGNQVRNVYLSGKTYVARLSTECYSITILFKWAFYTINNKNSKGLEILKCHGLWVLC